jgi:hypothetical protein
MHTGVRQTTVQIIKTMETDEVMNFIYTHQQVKNRRLADRETVTPCQNLAGLQLSPLILQKHSYTPLVSLHPQPR